MNLEAIEHLAVTVTFVAAALAGVAFLLELGLRKSLFKGLGLLGMGVALLGAGATLVTRAMIAQHAPWSNLWESMITVLFASLIFYFVVEIWYRPRHFGVVAAPLVLIIIGGASILPPGFKGAAPLMPALQSYWIKIHVLIMLFSYAAFTMSFAAALAYFFFSWRKKQAATAGARVALQPASAMGPPLEFGAGETTSGATDRRGTDHASSAAIAPSPFDGQLAFFDELTYRLILMGFPLLMLGIITGAMWANGAWGTYWSWDPKETWALITWFVYAAYLHARISRDWTGDKAAGLAGLGFVSMVVTYIGVNYLSSGLHSYGFLR